MILRRWSCPARNVALLAVALAAASTACSTGPQPRRDGGHGGAGDTFGISTGDAALLFDVSGWDAVGRDATPNDAYTPPLSCESSMAAMLPRPDVGPGMTATEPRSCPSCPRFGEVRTSVASTVAMISGTVTEATSCRWYLVSSGCGGTSGAFAPDEFTIFDLRLPLFCGTNVLQLVCEGSAGRTVTTRAIEGPLCERDLQVTLTWTDRAFDMELHLVQDGARINDARRDCTWFTCMGGDGLDWGVPGRIDDNPRKDVDDVTEYGPENVYLNDAPLGRYHVMVEYWGRGEPDVSEVTIALGGRTVWRGSRAMSLYDVWHVGTIDFPEGRFTEVGTLTSCASAWRTGGSYGCALAIP